MTTVNDVLNELGSLSVAEGSALVEVYSFFRNLPGDLDLASAGFYLQKEFNRNDYGIDDRVEIYTIEPDTYSGYDEDGDESEYYASDFDDDDDDPPWL